jgi:hypothetical protein
VFLALTGHAAEEEEQETKARGRRGRGRAGQSGPAAGTDTEARS